jgi:endoglucanase
MIPNAADSHRSALDDNNFKMPADSSSANDKLILTLHHYPLNDHLWKSQSWDLSLMEEEFSKLNEKFIEKGIPIVMGEIGPCGTDSIEKALGRPLTEEEAYAPCSDLTKIAAKYGMSVIMFPREYGLGNLDFTKRLVNEYLETAKTNEDENEIIIGNNFWIAEGQGSYDTDTQTLQLTQQYADFALTPEYEAKGNYICIEYENLEGMLILCAIYDEGDNNFYNEGNPDSTLTLKAADTKAYLRLEESNLKISKKIKIKLHRRNKDGEAKIKIKKIYFTNKTYIADEERKQPVVDTASPVSFDNSISAVNLVKDMSVGFNLGNCYEAYNSMEDDADAYLYWDGAGYWKSYTMSKDVIEDLAAKFGKDSKGKSNAKSIRIPVTWFNHIIDDKYTIDPNWMETVKQAVDCAYELGFYVILNSHHDIRPDMNSPLKYHEGYIARNTAADIAESERFLKAIWEQITKAFNNSYDEHLIFETMNEPGNRHMHWGVQKGCSICQDSARLVNQYNQLVLDTIRASGGNNANRFVMIPGMGTSVDTALAEYFELPKDSAKDKLLVTVHMYPLDSGGTGLQSHHFNSTTKNYITNKYADLNKKFTSKGIPVVLGECGASRNAGSYWENGVEKKIKDYVVTYEDRINCFTHLAQQTGKYSMPLINWDCGGSWGMATVDRKNRKIVEPEYNAAVIKAWQDANKNPAAVSTELAAEEIDLSRLTIWQKDASSYNTKTGLLKLGSGWKGCDLWFGEKDLSSSSKLIFDYKDASAAFVVQIVYSDDTKSQNYKTATNKTSITIPLDTKKKLKQVIFMSENSAVKVTLEKLAFSN